MFETRGYAAISAKSRLVPHAFNRRDPGPDDIRVEILYCGVCHTDVMFSRNEIGHTSYPLVPGHEIVGRVTQIGADVKRFSSGDFVGVGGFVDSCRVCSNCDEGNEQFCDSLVPTYGAPDKGGLITQGGYAKSIVVDENYAVRIPEALDLAAAAPLLCAGITMYSPLRQWKVGKGSKVGVVGLGGLGHMGVMLARAMGAEVTVFTTTLAKKADALRLGASEAIISRDAEDMKRHINRYDLILDTVSPSHDLNAYLSLLRRYGTLVLVGVPPAPHSAPDTFLLLGRNRALAGSAVGGIRHTQEMLNFCAAHGIVANIELIAMNQVDDAFERMLKSDVRYRFVIDLATLA
jgi:uncharacterized zinc-type alcohol dehydrogenase-like protein